MGDFFFVLKTLVLTFILLIVMQIKVSGVAIETHVYRWMKKSAIVENLKGVASGAVALADKGYDSAMEMVESKSTSGYPRESKAGSAPLELNFDRKNFRWDNSKKSEEKNEESSPSDDSLF